MNFFSNRAFAAFTVALAASMWALFTDIGRPYLPSVPIAIYTIYLYGNRSAVGQLGGDALKDSPYFLGFLLTMFALFKIFNDVSANAAIFGQNPALMTQEVGGAVLTTIVGLFCRQALLALVQDEAPAEDDRLVALANAVTSHAVAFEVARQQFFREMADERARHGEELRSTQARFLSQLDSFTASRDVMARESAPAAASAALSVAPAVAQPPVAQPPVAQPPVVESRVDSERPIETARSVPYAGPSSSGAVPASPSVVPPPDAAAGLPAPSGGHSAIRNVAPPPYPPYLGQGRASDTPRSEG